MPGSGPITNESSLIAFALALAGPNADLSPRERALAAEIPPTDDMHGLAALSAEIARGGDPLGAAFCRLRLPRQRRDLGATYTPPQITGAMLTWAVREARGRSIARVIDPGAGSGRFLMEAAARLPDAALIAVEIDPLAALLLRANLAARGIAQRARVVVGDFRDLDLAPCTGRTLFIGNPPYLRHHAIAPEWKDWYAAGMHRHGLSASKLAGLHLHFFLKTLDLAHRGDLGCYVTASEWLDVNYGAPLRKLLTAALGLRSIHVLDPKAHPFEDAVTTGAIACFEIGAESGPVRVERVATIAELSDLAGGTSVARATLASAPRWTLVLRPAPAVPPGWTELGEICRVHRGQVTGANAVWIAGPKAAGLPARVLLPAVTKARELLADDALSDGAQLRRVIDLPMAWEELPERDAIARFLDWARAQGADRGYIARHRPAWWAVGLKPPAPILCTYMARRPPAFVRNRVGARHINIAHGLYPCAPLDGTMLDALAAFLRGNVAQSAGRTYAGGLTKFEPREMERIAVPRPESLGAFAASAAE